MQSANQQGQGERKPAGSGTGICMGMGHGVGPVARNVHANKESATTYISLFDSCVCELGMCMYVQACLCWLPQIVSIQQKWVPCARPG